MYVLLNLAGRFGDEYVIYLSLYIIYTYIYTYIYICDKGLGIQRYSFIVMGIWLVLFFSVSGDSYIKRASVRWFHAANTLEAA